MLDVINQYSNLFIAIAAIVSAFFAGVIWRETRKYRQITHELKELNRRIFEQERPNLRIELPERVEDNGYAAGRVKFFIPVWIINLSSKPDSLLRLDILANQKEAVVYHDTSHIRALKMPLQEPINVSPRSTEIKYVFFETSLNFDEKMFPVFEFRLAYKGTDHEIKTLSIRFQSEYVDRRFVLLRIDPASKE